MSNPWTSTSVAGLSATRGAATTERDGDRQRQQQLRGLPNRSERDEAAAAHRPANATSCTQNARVSSIAAAVRPGTVRRPLLVQLASARAMVGSRQRGSGDRA